MEAFFKTFEPCEKMGFPSGGWIGGRTIDASRSRHRRAACSAWLNYLYYQRSRKNGKRGLSFSRWGRWSDHKNPIFFSGDCCALWPALCLIAMTLPPATPFVSGGRMMWAASQERNGNVCALGAVQHYKRSLPASLAGDEKLDRLPWKWENHMQFDPGSVSSPQPDDPYIYSRYRSARTIFPCFAPCILNIG